MYNYSNLKTMMVKNFRNIGEVTIDFSESPIISLIGNNEAGKTSVVKAFATAALHAYARDQKGFIRDGTNGFGVMIELEDGSKITRVKTNTLNQYSVETSDGKLWDTHKIDSGLPLEVQNLMGLVQEPETKEFLQVRTYEDQLLFVVTPASTNYKVMYDALKVDQLTKAIKLGSRESNSLKADINESETGIRTLTDNLRQIRTIDLEPILNIKNRLNDQIIRETALRNTVILKGKIQETTKQLGALKLIKENNLDTIDIVKADKLVNANRIMKRNAELNSKQNNYNKAKALEQVDLTTLNKVMNIIDRKHEQQRRIEGAGALRDLHNVKPIDEYSIRSLERASNLVKSVRSLQEVNNIVKVDNLRPIKQEDFSVINQCLKVRQLVDRNKALEKGNIELKTAIGQINDYLKSLGVSTTSCPNCGETVVMEGHTH